MTLCRESGLRDTRLYPCALFSLMEQRQAQLLLSLYYNFSRLQWLSVYMGGRRERERKWTRGRMCEIEQAGRQQKLRNERASSPPPISTLTGLIRRKIACVKIAIHITQTDKSCGLNSSKKKTKKHVFVQLFWNKHESHEGTLYYGKWGALCKL